MKKTYLQPLTEVVKMETVRMICVSGGITSGNGIGYGGVDDGGGLDPSSRGLDDLFDEGLLGL